MPVSNPTASPESRRKRRRKDPQQQSQSPARQAAQPAEEASGNPQPSGDGLQKDPSPSAQPDDGARFEQVRQRAYELFVTRGDRSGDDEMADWLEAERQVDAERPR